MAKKCTFCKKPKKIVSEFLSIRCCSKCAAKEWSKTETTGLKCQSFYQALHKDKEND